MIAVLETETHLPAAAESLCVTQTRAEWGVCLTGGLAMAAMAVHVATHSLSDTSLWAATSYLLGLLMSVWLAAVAMERYRQ